MQTLNRDSDGGVDPIAAESPPRPRRTFAFVVALVAAMVASAGIAYAAGSSGKSTRVVVREVPTPAAPPAPAAKPKCIPGAAPGSCNTDEANEVGVPDEPLDAKTRSQLALQLVAAREAAMKYPTVADARAAGMLQAGGFSPLTGAHFINIRGAVGNFDPSNPGSYIYDGINPRSKLIGLMYLSLSLTPPEGFAGPNDRWHRHANTCVIYTDGQIKVPFAADSDVTRAQCEAVHGNFMRQTEWMVHAWVVPGWESPDGVFAHDNPDIRCADGTTHADAVGFCKGT
jgi:hypothetical protein